SNPYECQLCAKSFATVPQLDRHRKVHQLKRHSCQICEKSFVEKFNLKTHMMVHTRERPRHCNQCGKKFRSDFRFFGLFI
ncbi:UNVERIFIED_CONTAM: hypothetical protein GTU68_060845, partial [Idotea baltica]|nr:hypothetical protein [Idotea baltica]